MSDYELYVNAPVVVATIEIRHTETAALNQPERRALREYLKQWTPIQRSSKQLTVTAVVPGNPASNNQSLEEFPKYFSRDSTVAVSLRREALVVETTNYAGWEALKVLLSASIEARMQAGPPDATERVGLRYINEIRPGGRPPVDWNLWVNDRITGPAGLSDAIGLKPQQWQGVAVYGPEGGRSMVLRYGPGQDQSVDTGQELVRSPVVPGPLMWVDIDSIWVHEGLVPDFQLDMLVAKCDELHKPIHDVFEELITEKTRVEVLTRG